MVDILPNPASLGPAFQTSVVQHPMESTSCWIDPRRSVAHALPQVRDWRSRPTGRWFSPARSGRRRSRGTSDSGPPARTATAGRRAYASRPGVRSWCRCARAPRTTRATPSPRRSSRRSGSRAGGRPPAAPGRQVARRPCCRKQTTSTPSSTAAGCYSPAAVGAARGRVVAGGTSHTVPSAGSTPSISAVSTASSMHGPLVR
jgi:hypothetical protein